MAQFDRGEGLVGTLGVKAPCRVATTANITLYGLQTIDGITVLDGDRVLVKDQTNPIDNGIWYAAVGTWDRAPDLDGIKDVLNGTLVVVANGTVSSGYIYRTVCATDAVPGANSLTFVAQDVTPASFNAFIAALAASTGSTLVGHISGGANTVATTVQTKLREFRSALDKGAVGGGLDESTQIQNALTEGITYFGRKDYKTDTAITGSFGLVSFGGTFSGINAIDAPYPAFGAGALRVITRGATNSIIGICHNNAAPSTAIFPTGVTGMGRNDNTGNTAFGGYFEARQYAISGVVTNEIDSFNMTATAPSAALPPDRSFGTGQQHPIALTVAAGGTENSSIGIHITPEGSSPQKFLTGIYFSPDSVETYPLFIDADATSTYSLSAVIKHKTSSGGCLQVQGIGAVVPGNVAITYIDGTSAVKWGVRQSGLQIIPASLTQTTHGAAGAAAALPSNPTGYMQFEVNGLTKIVPYYEPL